jgi:hypothetical protein
MSRAAIEAALDALEAGDLALLEAILLGALEDEWSTWAPGPSSTNTSRPVVTCRQCNQTFAWPGLRDHHEQFAHPLEDAA